MAKVTESKEAPKKKQKYNAQDYCSLKKLNLYHTEAIMRAYGKQDNKTIEEWDKFLISKKYVSPKVLGK